MCMQLSAFLTDGWVRCTTCWRCCKSLGTLKYIRARIEVPLVYHIGGLASSLFHFLLHRRNYGKKLLVNAWKVWENHNIISLAVNKLRRFCCALFMKDGFWVRFFSSSSSPFYKDMYISASHQYALSELASTSALLRKPALFGRYYVWVGRADGDNFRERRDRNIKKRKYLASSRRTYF